MQATATTCESVTKLIPGGERKLAHLSDSQLLASTRRLVGKSNELFAALLLHLAEVETRGVHRQRACSSLYTYCIYELRMSEDAAARRSSAARLVKQFPLLFDAVAKGELHLTGLLMLGPHLTPENHVEVLARAKHRTKKEIAKLVRELYPLPRVPDVIESLGPELVPARQPTWQQWVTSLAPPVRELPRGNLPSEWANDADHTTCRDGGHEGEAEPVPSADESEATGVPYRSELPPLSPITGPQQYQMQFSTGEEHVQLVERAKALMARAAPAVSLGELHLEAMKLLVASLEKKRFAVNTRPREQGKPTMAPHEGREVQPPRRRVEPCAAPLQDAPEVEAPRKQGVTRSRYVPAAVRRAVFERDCGQCSYVDERGKRCTETHHLELHHAEPFAKGGEHRVTNLSLRCAAHNALAAEQDFGCEAIRQKRDALRHDSFEAQFIEGLGLDPAD